MPGTTRAQLDALLGSIVAEVAGIGPAIEKLYQHAIKAIQLASVAEDYTAELEQLQTIKDALDQALVLGEVRNSGLPPVPAEE